MHVEDTEQLIRSWIELHKVPRESQRHAELFWSYSQLDDLVRQSPEAAWDAILEILRTDQSRSTLQNLSAGPLEDLLAKHGPTFIERVERFAIQDAQFNYLLGGVWQNSMTDDIWQRVQKARKHEW